MNELLFAGYGRGSVSDQARESAFNDSNIQQYPFAADFLNTTVDANTPKLQFNLWYNNTDITSQDAGWTRFRRIPKLTNSMTNAFLNKLLDPNKCAANSVTVGKLT